MADRLELGEPTGIQRVRTGELKPEPSITLTYLLSEAIGNIRWFFMNACLVIMISCTFRKLLLSRTSPED